MNKDIEKLFKQAKGYVEVDEEGNRSTYTYDFDPDVFASLIIEQCVQTLVNHGYTDAATMLSTEYADDWQQLEFPEI
jgi:predicted adenine nucleotide alpha hydrolase (AANH) superfamily ATPase